MHTISNCFIGCDKNPEISDIIIFGVPYDGTSSFRPGSRFAPDRIREASYGLETFSPEYDMDIENLNLSDVGNIEIPFGDKARVLEEIKKYTKLISETGKKTLCLGGEHLITLPVVEVLAETYRNLKIIHLDAHADMRESYLGEKLSHATVLNRVAEIVGHESIFHYGIRSGTAEEFKKLSKYENLNINTGELVKRIDNNPVYLTADLDILDTSVLPGTGTPEPGGISFKELAELLYSFKGLNFIGADAVELAPDYDVSGVSNIVAAKAVRNIICLLMQKK